MSMNERSWITATTGTGTDRRCHVLDVEQRQPIQGAADRQLERDADVARAPAKARDQRTLRTRPQRPAIDVCDRPDVIPARERGRELDEVRLVARLAAADDMRVEADPQRCGMDQIRISPVGVCGSEIRPHP